MRGVTFPGERAVEIMNFPDPTPGPGEVVLEMKASGMCGSDLHQYRRPKNVPRTGSGIPPSTDPVIAGHEPCGVVVAVGPGVGPARSQGRRPHDGASLSGLHPVQPLPLGLAAALPGGAGEGLWQQRPRRPRQVPEGAGQHDGAAAREPELHGGCCHLLRLGHRLRRAPAHEPLRPRHDRHLRPGAGGPRRHAIRQGDGRAG